MGTLNSKHALFQVDHGIQKLIFYFIRCELSMRLALAMSSAFAEIAEFHENLKLAVLLESEDIPTEV